MSKRSPKQLRAVRYGRTIWKLRGLLANCLVMTAGEPAEFLSPEDKATILRAKAMIKQVEISVINRWKIEKEK